MQLESLKAFCDLAETRSFTRAAEINDITQAAMSQAVSGLERHFKTPLIERSKRNSRLTREGEILYQSAKEMLETFTVLQSAIKEVKKAAAGHLRVAALYSIGMYLLPPCLNRLSQSLPKLKVSVAYGSAAQIIEKVRANNADVGFLTNVPADAALEVVRLGRESLVLICPPGHPLGKFKTVKPKQLAGENFISLRPRLPTRRLLDQILKTNEVTVKHVLELDNLQTVKSAVEAESGLAIVPETMAMDGAEGGSLEWVSLEGNFFRPVVAIRRKKRPATPALKELLKQVKDLPCLVAA